MTPDEQRLTANDIAGMMLFNGLIFFLERKGLLNGDDLIEYLQAYVELTAPEGPIADSALKKIEMIANTRPHDPPSGR